MEADSLRGLLVPPAVIAMLGGLFYSFGVFDTLLASDPKLPSAAPPQLQTPAETPALTPLAPVPSGDSWMAPAPASTLPSESVSQPSPSESLAPASVAPSPAATAPQTEQAGAGEEELMIREVEAMDLQLEAPPAAHQEGPIYQPPAAVENALTDGVQAATAEAPGDADGLELPPEEQVESQEQ